MNSKGSDENSLNLEALTALKSEILVWDEFRLRHPVIGDALVGSDLSETDLAGRNFSGLDLSDTDLFQTKLSQANLKHTKLNRADLSGADLSDSGLYKAEFNAATLTVANLKGCDLREADLSGADLRGADLTGADLSGARLCNANLTNADLRESCLENADIAGASLSKARIEGANVTGLSYGALSDMRGCYLGVRGLDSAYGNALFIRDAKDQDYIDTLEASISKMPSGYNKSLKQWLFKAWGLFDQGRSLSKVGIYAFLLATLYGIIYTFDMTFEWGMMDYSNSAQSWFTPFYYSMVTYTTLGYGDVTAENVYGEILVISEVVLGYFTLGLLLSIIANTIARRS